MSLRAWLRDVFTGHAGPKRQSDAEATDTHSTTGTTSHGTFVGQASGDDPGIDVEAPEDKRKNEHEGSAPEDPERDEQ